MSSMYTSQKVCCDTASTSPETTSGVNLHIAVFFDGTCNNRINSRQREFGTASYQNVLEKHPNEKGDIPTQRNSFENDKSNIALMYENFTILNNTETDYYHSEYIEGVGTEDYLPDSKLGAGLGDYGNRSLTTKVRKGCEKIKDFINQLKRIEIIEIKEINFTVFGFSRGAAAARNFVHEVMREAYIEYVPSGMKAPSIIAVKRPKGGILGSLLSNSVPLNNVKVKYVGLFDTVSAFGLMHSNDVKELGLDAISKADNVFQIAAIDEYRKKFELTTIDSAGGKGKQLFLPGCHSDIGGGFSNNTVEDIAKLLPKTPIAFGGDYRTTMTLLELHDKECEAEVKRLKEEGWFDPSTVKKEKSGKYSGTRRVANGYSSIPLAIMIKESVNIVDKFGVVKTDKIPQPYNLESTTSKLIKEVGSVLLEMYQSMLNKDLEQCRIDIATKISGNIKQLRQGYLHISHHYVTTYGFGLMEPRIVKGKLLREEYKG